MKTKLLAVFCLLLSATAFAQCFTPPAFSPCTGSEPMPIDNDVINSGQTKWYYGPPSTLNNVRLNGGTLVVCSEMTLTNLVFDSGKIFVDTDAIVTVSNSSGLIM